MLQVQPITKDSKNLFDFKKVYFSAFPRSEQTPIWFLLLKAKRDDIDFFAYYDDGVFAGFSYIITHGNLTFIQYIAVSANIRSKGYGTQIMSEIRKRYPGNRIILCIEAEDEKAVNNEQRKRRKSFYLKNGYSSANIMMKTNGIIFETLISDGTCSFKEFLMLYKEYLGFLLYIFYKPKMIR